jgi:4-alpha-glucanotransferase
VFADWLASARQSWWQLLPLGPPGAGGSPYDSPSAFAGSPSLVSLELVAREGLLGRHELEGSREQCLRLAHERFARRPRSALARELARFRSANRSWLRDWALFAALREAHGGAPWTAWDPALRRRERPALMRAAHELRDAVRHHELVQLLFQRQWTRLRAYCRERGIALLGDVPMFVAHDAADVWSHQELFFLDRRGEPSVVAGVPPDDFSATGQLWGNPLYRWKRLQQSGFAWWIARFERTLEQFDAVRLDHFIGFRRYWEVTAGAPNAQRGRFVRVPGEALFESAGRALGGLPFIAEDLGLVTEDVHALRRRFGLPGMRVLMFAFGEDGSDYLPHRFERNTVVYTGTHDNDTLVGWYRRLRASDRTRLHRYLGGRRPEVHWELIRLAAMSVANVALFPVQDLLGLGTRARMNMPGTTRGNWRWRLRPGELDETVAARLGELTRAYERHPGRS